MQKQLTQAAQEKLTAGSAVAEEGRLWQSLPSGGAKGTGLNSFRSKNSRKRTLVMLRVPKLHRIDMATELTDPRTKQFGYVTATGVSKIQKVTTKVDNITKENKVTTVSSPEIALQNTAGAPPDYFVISGLGEYAYYVWQDGTVVWFETRNLAKPRLLGVMDILAEPDAKLTQCELLLGGTTLLAGDSLGRVRAWFPSVNKPLDEKSIAPEVDQSYLSEASDPAQKEAFAEIQKSSATKSGQRPYLVVGHDLKLFDTGVQQIRCTPRDRTVLISDEGETLELCSSPTNRHCSRWPVQSDDRLLFAALAPQQTRLLTVGEKTWRSWSYSADHANISLSSMFGSIWYEGQSTPQYVWQTSGGESSEPAIQFDSAHFRNAQSDILLHVVRCSARACSRRFTRANSCIPRRKRPSSQSSN